MPVQIAGRQAMKAVILAGGKGTRLSEETQARPKPMIEIGGQPILWHIMKLYSSYGINDFVVCLGYRGYVIKEYFANYLLHRSDVTFDLARNQIQVHNCASEPWRVTLVDTGEDTMTGGLINSGFFVLAPSAIDYVEHDMQPWEAEPMERLAADGQLGARRHDGFWQCMDTLRDKTLLEDLWQTGAPWARWDRRAAA